MAAGGWWLTTSVPTSSVVDGTVLSWGQEHRLGRQFNYLTLQGSNIVCGDTTTSTAFSQSLNVLFSGQ